MEAVTNYNDITENHNSEFKNRGVEMKNRQFAMNNGESFSTHIFQQSEINFNETSRNLNYINKILKKSSIKCLVVWVCLIIFSYKMCPEENIRKREGAELYAVVLASAVQFISFSSRILPRLIVTSSASSTNGLFIASSTVQFVAMLTNFFMAIFPSPVMIDPVTDRRVHLLRWCEWAPLAFLMTLMTELVGMENAERKIKSALVLAFSQGFSTVFGIFFPFCSFGFWMIFMTISCILYLFMFPRLYQKQKLFQKQKQGKSVEELEKYNRLKYSYKLLYVCTVMWTVLVVSYFVAAFAPFLVLKNSLLQSPAYTMLSECTVDVIIKVIYLNIMNDVQNSIFDDKARSRRRLKELKSMMNVVWESSSDIIIISVCRSNSDVVTTMVSPTFSRRDRIEFDLKKHDQNAILFEMRLPDMYPNVDADSIRIEPMSLEFLGGEKRKKSTSSTGAPVYRRESILSLADVVAKSWESTERECLFTHDLVTLDGSTIQAEARLNRFQEHSLIVVLRDVTERFMRFEAEKKAVSETTARQKDAEANRFTRHEVKNGLLAAIEQCTSLESYIVDNFNSDGVIASRKSSIPQSVSSGSLTSTGSGPHDISRYVTDLHVTLHEVLDTVLAEAMSREVINEVYRPVLEQVDIATIIYESLDSANIERFPIKCNPMPFPNFYFDPQLLKYIHRNAVSNAIKYGEKGGTVCTELQYNALTRDLAMNVINMPGEGHSDLVAMGDVASKAVFVQGRRLHYNIDTCGDKNHISSGDGAWIVQKCAKTLGGKCTIRFDDHQTVFSFRCRADPYISKGSPTFQVPENTYGIVIDDSKIQRKLMQKLLNSLGFRPDRYSILGKDGNEILLFEQYVIEKMHESPSSYFLAIVDENLDINDADFDHANSHANRISGSKCVDNIRRNLPPHLEKRLLALIRSANDSPTEFALYNSRAHGFLAKAPMKADRMNDLIRHLWMKRFRDNPGI